MLGLTPSPLFCMINFPLKIHHLQGYIIKLHKFQKAHQNRCNNISAKVLKGSQHLIQDVLSSKCFIATEKNEKVLTSLTAMVRLCVRKRWPLLSVRVRSSFFFPTTPLPSSSIALYIAAVRNDNFFSRWT